MGNENSKPIELNENGKILEKHENGGVNGLAVKITSDGLEINGVPTGNSFDDSEKAVHQNGEPISLIPNTESNCTDSAVMEDGQLHKCEDQISENTDNTTKEERAKKPKKINPFDKMFTKKRETFAAKGNTETNESLTENHTDVASPANTPQLEPANIKQDSKIFEESKSVSQELNPEEGELSKANEENNPVVESQEESYTEEKTVMNFFKTLVTPTKTSKKEKVTPDAPKDQSQQQIPPTEPSTTVAAVPDPPAAPRGMSIPPPPPPEPPKMEFKGEPAAKLIKPTPKEQPKAAAKETEASKAKLAKDTLNRFFHSKALRGGKASKAKGTSTSGTNAHGKTAAVTELPQPDIGVQNENIVELKEEAAQQPVVNTQEIVEELPQPVVEVKTVEVQQPVIQDQKVDASKTSTLEAAAKTEVPLPVVEEKKPPSKSSFISLFKPKVLLNQMGTKIQTASTSGVRLLRKTAGVAAGPKKEGSAQPAATAGAQAARTIDEPKASVKPTEAPVDNSSVSGASQGGEEAVNVPRKLEKRNSIHLFFKSLGQKRPSTDAGVQTEPMTATPAPAPAK